MPARTVVDRQSRGNSRQGSPGGDSIRHYLPIYLVGWIVAVCGHFAIQFGLVPTLLLRVIVDVVVHGLFAVLVVAPLFLVRGARSWILFSVTAAVLIDIDHAYAAGSIHLVDLVSLPVRPATHSLVFALATGIVLSLVATLARSSIPAGIVGYAGSAATASHVLRDATSGPTPWAWPLPPVWIPSLLFLGVCVGLTIVAYLVAMGSANPVSVQRIRD